MTDTPNRPPLSPAAQAVWDAAWNLSPVNCESHEDRRRQQIAAALRACADQVVPEMQEPDWGSCVNMHCDIELYTDHQRKRSALLAIAAELEGGNG